MSGLDKAEFERDVLKYHACGNPEQLAKLASFVQSACTQGPGSTKRPRS